MSYCTKCGAPLSGGRYCTRCGAPVLPQDCTPASQKGKRGLSIAGTVIGICTNVLLFTTCCTYSPLLTVLFFLCAVTGLIISIFGKVNEPGGRGFAISGIILCAVAVCISLVIEALLIADMLDHFDIAPADKLPMIFFIS